MLARSLVIIRISLESGSVECRGIGGGGFMLVRSSEGEYETIDFREKAPLLSNETMYVQNINLSIFGGLAVGVPGELAGILEQLRYN